MDKKSRDEFIVILKDRFERNMTRHKKVSWDDVRVKLESDSKKVHILYQMECSGGEPDVVDYDEKTKEFIFYDCSAESPVGRRSLCYDNEALESRKKHKPSGSAVEMAALIGIEMLTEKQYRYLQKLGEFDKKTSSWVKTPIDIRQLGGAIFCDRRYEHIFLYHNGAESYYAARGFRGCLKL